jgi:hypothetical protein
MTRFYPRGASHFPTAWKRAAFHQPSPLLLSGGLHQPSAQGDES